MGLFEQANEIVILSAGRKVEWADVSPPATSEPSTSTDGYDIGADAPIFDLWVDPASPVIADIWVYHPGTRNGPAGWSKWREDEQFTAKDTYRRYRDAGAVTRVALVVRDGSITAAKIGTPLK